MFTLTSIALLIITLTISVDPRVTALGPGEKAIAFMIPEGKKCLKLTGYDPKTQGYDTMEGMCFYKCVMREKGILNENGELNLEHLDSLSEYYPQYKETQVKQCMIDAGKIETCEDMSKYYACEHLH